MSEKKSGGKYPEALKTPPTKEEMVAARAAWRLKDGRGGGSFLDAKTWAPWMNSAAAYFPGSGYDRFEREFVGTARARAAARAVVDASRAQLLEVARMRVEQARSQGFDVASLGVDSDGNGKLDAMVVEPSARAMVERTHPEGSKQREALNLVGPSVDLPRIVQAPPGVEALIEWVLGPKGKQGSGRPQRQSEYAQFPGDGRLIEMAAKELAGAADPSDPSAVRAVVDRLFLERIDGLLFAKSAQDQTRRAAMVDEVASFKPAKRGEVHPTVKAACSMVAGPGAGFDACVGFMARAMDGERRFEEQRKASVDRQAAEDAARAAAMAKDRCEQAGQTGDKLGVCVEKLSAASVEEFRKRAADQKAQDPVDRAYAKFRRD